MTSPDPAQGIVIANKPEGITSNDFLRQIKKTISVKKAGHSGTLDLFASGLMVIATGRYTRLTRYFLDSEKKYRAVIQLGRETDTCDPQGEVIATGDVHITREDVERVMPDFTGKIRQVPPSYSALKIKGKRASDRVRNGEEVVLEPREVEIFSLLLEHFDEDRQELVFSVHCSKGTYIRSLARDMGRALGARAFCSALERRASGHFALDMIPHGEAFTVLTPGEALSHLFTVSLTGDGAGKVSHGRAFSREDVLEKDLQEGIHRVLYEGKLIAVAFIEPGEWTINYDAVFNS